MTAPAPADLPLGMDARTFSVWFKLDAIPNRPMEIAGYGPNGGATGGDRFALCIENGKIGAELCGQYSYMPWTPDTDWHLLTVVVPDDCENVNQILVYLDGQEGANSWLNPGIFDTLSSPLEIGRMPTVSWTYGFAGSVQEVLLFNSALDTTQIAALYDSDPGAYALDPTEQEHLIAGYHLDEGLGTVAHDFSGNGNDGTLEGDTTWVPGNIAGTSAVATLTTSTLSVGSHTLTAAYSGDANNSSSTSASITQVVDQATPPVTLMSSPNPSTYGQSVALTATLPSQATGTVTFDDGDTTIGTATLQTIPAALHFDGSGSSYVTAPAPADLPLGMAARTFSVWFKLDAIPNRPMEIAGYGPNGGATGGDRFALCIENGKIGAELCGQYSYMPWTPDTDWHLLTVVVPDDCENVNQILVYLDGQEGANSWLIPASSTR